MLNVATAAEMQAIDRHAIEQCGIPGATLMENAGIRVFEFLRATFPNLAESKTLVFAGKGNNGGDGFVVARHLHNHGMPAEIFLLGRRDALKQDARLNADAAVAIGVPIHEIGESNLKSCGHALRHCRVVVDAILGTGLTSPAGGLYAAAIEAINASGKPVVAVDIASGIDSDSGQLIGPHIRARHTVALALLKRSHLLYPAAEAMGDVHVADISMPRVSVESQNLRVRVAEENDMRRIFPPRRPDSHKGTYGHVLVIAGSRGKGGASGLTGLAALRAGAGLVTLAVPQGCHQALEFNPLECMSVPLAENAEGCLTEQGADTILQNLPGKTAVAIGPGLSTHGDTLALLEAILPRIECPVALDADGLNLLAMSPGLLSRLKAPAVLTPHPKEMARLCGVGLKEILADKMKSAREFAQRHGIHVILKGANSLIASPDGTVHINATGNPGMASAGTGDVLTGIVAGLLAQGITPQDAAIAGAYIHGLAGDITAGETSETSLIAGDLLRTLPQALKRILP